MTSTAEEKAFLRVAVAAIPRVAEIIWRFPPGDRAGALERAERCFLAAALDYGCTEITAQSRVSAVDRNAAADGLFRLRPFVGGLRLGGGWGHFASVSYSSVAERS